MHGTDVGISVKVLPIAILDWKFTTLQNLSKMHQPLEKLHEDSHFTDFAFSHLYYLSL